MNLNQLDLVLPFAPSINDYYHATKKGRCLKSHVVAYKTEVLYRFKKEISIRFGDKPVSVAIDIYPPDKRRRDVDNPLKMLFDVLQELGVYNDDSQIVHCVIDKRQACKDGKIKISICEHETAVKDKKYSFYYYCFDKEIEAMDGIKPPT